MATVTGKVELKISMRESDSIEFSAPMWAPTLEYKKEYTTSGVGDGQLDLLWGDSARALTGAEDLDLAGSLTSRVGGGTITFVDVAGFCFSNLTETATETLTIGGKATNTFINWVSNATDEVIVMPQGCLFLNSYDDGSDSYGVAAGTGDILEVTSSAALTYDVMIWGRSA